MSRSTFRWALGVAAIATLSVAAAPARADGTPTQPPSEPPPSEPLSPQQVQVQPQPAGVPPYGVYQKRHHRSGSHWYGWQTLIVDGATTVGGTVLAGVDPGIGGAVVVGGYFLGPPIVHFAHGRVGKGFADLGIRVGAPLVLGTIGYFALHGSGNGLDNDVDGAVGLVLGVGLGIIAAIVVDAAALAYEPWDDDDEDGSIRQQQRRNAARPTITPMLAPRKEGGAVFGISGTL